MGNMSGKIMNTMDYLTDDPRNNCVKNMPVQAVVVYSVSTTSPVPEQNLGSHNKETMSNYTISRPFDTTEAKTNLPNQETKTEETEESKVKIQESDTSESDEKVTKKLVLMRHNLKWHIIEQIVGFFLENGRWERPII